MGVGGQRHGPAALPPEKTRYPPYRRLGGPSAGQDMIFLAFTISFMYKFMD
jgi:hypothetical protein